MATEKAFPRPQFDGRRDFIVNRQFLLSGVDLAPGAPFDKTTVSVRTLRQLYDGRYIRINEGSNTPLIPPRTISSGPELPPSVVAAMHAPSKEEREEQATNGRHLQASPDDGPLNLPRPKRRIEEVAPRLRRMKQ